MSYTTDHLIGYYLNAGYSCYARIFSMEYEITDKLQNAIKFFDEKFREVDEVRNLSISYYGAWQEEYKPCVYCFLTASFNQGFWKPETLKLTYKENNIEMLTEEICCKDINAIPSQRSLSERLTKVLNSELRQSYDPGKTAKNSNGKRIRY